MPIGDKLIEQIRIKVGGADIDPSIMDKILEVVVDSSLHLPDMCIIHLTDTDNFDIADSGPFDIGKEVEIQFGKADETRTTYKVFKGEITALEPSFNSDVSATLTVRGYTKAHRLSHGTKMRVFTNVSDSDIVRKIAQENGLTAEVSTTAEVYEHVYQHNQTDMEFLSERAQRIGYEVYVDETKLIFQPPKGARGQAQMEWGADLLSFQPRLSTHRQVSKVVVLGWDSKQKKPIRGEATSSDVAPKVGYGKNGIQSSKVFGNYEEYVTRRLVNTQREAEILAKALLDEINSGFIEADGVCFGNPDLKAGMKVKITKVSQKFAGEYITTAVRHVYNAVDGYMTQFSVQGARPLLMTDLIRNQSVFSDQDRFFNSVVPAIVTNINDPDNKGRVKVKFPWMNENLESAWARVATIGAGNQRGLLWLPEVEDEVLVAFEHGDFNRPYVIGSLWNGKDAPPDSWTNAAQNGKSEQRTIKTRVGHTIRFVDGPSDKYIEIVDSAQGTTIKLDANTNKLSINSKDEISIETQTNLKIKTSGNSEIESTGNVTVKGNGKVNVQGSAGVDINSSGVVNIKGSMVNIN
jgi:phage protein D/phage baseplate assembly protein gpV